jgi:AcrR family transcriptional regulator
MSAKKRLGRPPDTTSDETRQRILAAARECFSKYGYSKTTNKDIAQAADITTGAIYHYFDSKQALFAEVTNEVSRVVFDEFERVVADEPAFVDKFRALLDAASKLHAEDHSLARFSAIYPIEAQRHPELASVLDPMLAGRAATFFQDLARGASERGELPDDLPPEDVANMIGAVTLGLANYGALSPTIDEHRGAVVALQRIFSRAFESPPTRKPAPGRRAPKR